MYIFMFLVSAFCGLRTAVTHSALKPQGGDGRIDNNDGSLHKRLSRVEAILLADDTLRNRLSALEKEIKRVGEENKLLRDVMEKQDSTLKQLTVEIKKLQSDNVRLERFCQETSVNIISTEDDENQKLVLGQHHQQSNLTTFDSWHMVKNNDRSTKRKYNDFSPTSQDSKTWNYFGKAGFIPQRHIRQSGVVQVAFYSTVSLPDLANLGLHQPVVFDRVVTNVGGAYHPNLGVFITPVDGVYVFFLGGMSRPGKQQCLELVKDGYWIQSIYPDAASTNSFASESRVAVLELHKGNEVWVRATGGSGEIRGYSHTVFSGWLL